MSFSQIVKEELAAMDVRASHCRIAELSAILAFDGSADEDTVCFRADSAVLRSRVFTLLRKTFKIDTNTICTEPYRTSGTGTRLRITDPALSEVMVRSLTIRDAQDLTERICSRSCCVRAFLRGAFLAAGSLSDPRKSYHFEIVCPSGELAQQTIQLIHLYGIDARMVLRKGRCVIYVKEGTQIVDLLNIMGAHGSLMQMENVRIVKDVRNRVNRQVNCETANLTRTVNASVREIEEIRRLEEAGILGTLKPALQETARLRAQYPEASLRELGELHDPPIGRSGVNHRLKKIGEIASKLPV